MFDKVLELKIAASRRQQAPDRLTGRFAVTDTATGSAYDFRSANDEPRPARNPAEADTFVLYRIIGNDLPPRHREAQSIGNVEFILDNEPALENRQKRWIVNRIVDAHAEEAIIRLLTERQQRFLRIPFDIDEYARIDRALEDFPEPAFFLVVLFASSMGRCGRSPRLTSGGGRTPT